METETLASTQLGPYRLLTALPPHPNAFLACHEGSDRDPFVVLTRLEGSRALDRLSVARDLTRLRHPNVASVLSAHAQPTPFVVSRWVDGQPLSEAIRRLGHDPDARIVMLRALGRVLSALRHAHKGGGPSASTFSWVHGALSSEQVSFSYSGEVMLTGFGGFGQCGEPQPPAFVAPECERGETPEARADVYAAGLLLWQVAVGRAVGEHCRNSEELQRLLESERAPLPEDGALRAIIRRAMRRDKSERYATARQMQRDVEGVAMRLASYAELDDLGVELAFACKDQRIRLDSAVRIALEEASPRVG